MTDLELIELVASVESLIATGLDKMLDASGGESGRDFRAGERFIWEGLIDARLELMQAVKRLNNVKQEG